VVCLTLSILSCDTEVEPTPQSQMALYIVDYNTNEFEAGTVLNLTKVDVSYTSLDIDIDEDPFENDKDGAISLIYDPTGEKIFEGALNPEGNASIDFPGFTIGDDFFEIDNPVSINTNDIQDIGEDYTEPVGPIWDAVDELGLTEIFVNSNALLGRFLYKPNDLNDENWKWIILLFDQ